MSVQREKTLRPHNHYNYHCATTAAPIFIFVPHWCLLFGDALPETGTQALQQPGSWGVRLTLSTALLAAPGVTSWSPLQVLIMPNVCWELALEVLSWFNSQCAPQGG